jgi:penicillin-binding protein 1A
MVIVDNSTGDIVALVGGVGTDKVHDGQNRAVDSKLQTGSSIKPISVYAPGFESGAINPATVIKDLPQRYDGTVGWPKNDNRKYNYARTIYSGISASVNAVAANTLEIIGTGYSYDFAKQQFGLHSLLDSYTAADGTEMSDNDFAPLALGAQTKGVTVMEMASAFATFPNNGVYREGRTYSKVYDSDGNLILDNTQESRQVLSEKTVNYMHYCLAGSVAGTGYNARISGQNVYGKTGTTASNKDRWFCGYTKYYTAAVWFGFDTPEVINLVQSGTNPAAILFSKVMSKIHTGLKKVELIDYSKYWTANVCLDSGKKAGEACGLDVRADGDFTRISQAMVYPEDYPQGTCDKHVAVEYCTEGCGVANEYCHLFAEAMAQQEGYDPEKPLIVKKALVKMTQEEIDELLKAEKIGLQPDYLRDDYIYLINKNGTDGKFKGLHKDQNKDVDAPYLVCSVHTQAAWEAYQQSIQPTEPETETTEPGETVAPTEGSEANE